MLAQDVTVTTSGDLGSLWPIMVIYLIVLVVMIAAVWKVFAKAGKPGWAAIIPIYNVIVMLEVVGRPIWWILLMLIPFVNIVIGIIIIFDLAKSFGKGAGFGFGLLFLSFIFYPILGFGSAQYVGPAGSSGSVPPPPPPGGMTA